MSDNKLKYAAAVVVLISALFGCVYAYEVVTNLYGDWQFLRQSRILYLQNQANIAAQKAQQTPQVAPAQTAPVQK